MLVYLTGKDSIPQIYSKYNIYKEASSLSRNVLQNEATEIICQDFLCCFNFKDLPKIIDLILSKMRKGCKLTIIEKDIKLIARQIYRESASIDVLNNKIFEVGQIIKSIFSLEDIISYIDTNEYKIVSKGFIDGANFSMTLERIK